MVSDNPILNSPYDEPKLHYDTDSEGSLDYNKICKGRRIFKPDAAVIPSRQSGQKEIFEWNDDAADQLPRIAFKMATGSGKTVVMACLICYHYFNRQEYRNDTRFADYFLIVAPGVTIKDRLGVLFVDTKNKNPIDIEDYYRV